MKRVLLTLLAVLALVSPAAAQVFIPDNSYGVSDAVTAVSTDVGIYVRYIGRNATTSTVAVDAATGDLAFVVAGAADATINPVTGGVGLCGNTAGTIDVSDADCNTIGTVIDQINGSPNWIAWPGSALRSDSADNTLITLAATPAQNGLALLKDTAVALSITLVLRAQPHDVFTGLLASSPGAPTSIAGNPERGIMTMLVQASENVTCGGGAIGNFAVFGLTQTMLPKRTKVAGAVAAAVSYTEVARTIWSQVGAACGSVGTITLPLLAQPGERVLVRVNSTVALTAPLVFATGYRWQSKNVSP